jgi:hypothetical protein
MPLVPVRSLTAFLPRLWALSSLMLRQGRVPEYLVGVVSNREAHMRSMYGVSPSCPRFVPLQGEWRDRRIAEDQTEPDGW